MGVEKGAAMLVRGLLLVSSLLVGVAACGSDDGSSEPDDAGSAPTSTPASTTPDDDSPPTTPSREPDDEFAPDPASIPTGVAPGGLGDAALPEDSEGGADVFGALPDEFHGARREIALVSPGQLAADYPSDERACAPTGFQALDLSVLGPDGFYPEGSTAEDVVAVFATGADWEVSGSGHDGDLYWVTWETTCGGVDVDGEETIHSATWGDAGSSMVFFAGAERADLLDELLSMFVDAASFVAATADAPLTDDEAAARAALLTADDLGPEWFGQPRPPDDDDPEADAVALGIMTGDPACVDAATWAERAGVSLTDLGRALVPDAPVEADSPTLTYGPDRTSEVEHTVLVFDSADDVAEAFRLARELDWSGCLQAVFDDLLQSQFDDVGLTLTDYAADETSLGVGDDDLTLSFGFGLEAAGDMGVFDTSMTVSYVRVGRAITIVTQFSFDGAIDDMVEDTVALAVDKVVREFG